MKVRYTVNDIKCLLSYQHHTSQFFSHHHHDYDTLTAPCLPTHLSVPLVEVPHEGEAPAPPGAPLHRQVDVPQVTELLEQWLQVLEEGRHPLVEGHDEGDENWEKDDDHDEKVTSSLNIMMNIMMVTKVTS